MSDWSDFAASAPPMAAAVRARLTTHTHHVMATLRADGWPRVSSIEVKILANDLLIGSMIGAVKVADLLRDGRLSIHTYPGADPIPGGDSKITGRAALIDDEPTREQIITELRPTEPAVFFRIDIAQIVHTALDPATEEMIIEMWTPTGGATVWTRRAARTAAVRR